jgi:bifunctional ADP-heptose synthase (sugar kinase/adenylyltransferase)
VRQPVFILKHDETETRPGGAANAAANIATLGGEPLLVGLISDDANGTALRAALKGSRVGNGYGHYGSKFSDDD